MRILLLACLLAIFSVHADEEGTVTPPNSEMDFHNFKLPTEGPMPARAPNALTDCSENWWRRHFKYAEASEGWQKYTGVSRKSLAHRERALKAAESWARTNDYLPCESVQMCGAVLETIPDHIAVYIASEAAIDGQGGFISPETALLIKTEDYEVVDQLPYHLGCAHYEKQREEPAS